MTRGLNRSGRAQGLSDNEIMESEARLIRAGWLSAYRKGDRIVLRLNSDVEERRRPFKQRP